VSNLRATMRSDALAGDYPNTQQILPTDRAAELFMRAVLRHGADKVERWIAADELPPPNGNGSAPPHTMSRLCTRPLSQVVPQPIRWAWKNRLAFGKVHMLDGFPGEGKSQLMMDIGARLTHGASMPDGTPGPSPMDVLHISYEDDDADTILPRVLSAGGDTSRFHTVTHVDRGGIEGGSPILPQDLDAVEIMLESRPEIGLFTVDPFLAALSAGVDSYKDQSVRPVLARLARIAMKFDVCVVLIRHVSKRGGPNAITAGGGSIGIIGQARIGLLVDKHPEDESLSVLAVSKSNIGPKPSSLSFRKEPMLLRNQETHEAIETCRIVWTGPVGVSADDLVVSRFEGGWPGEDARSWLREALADGVEHERKAVVEAALAAGHSERTIKRAAKAIGVVIRREGSGLAHRSHWKLQSTQAT
jgi:putative DNA primase/helicase